jgi:hypothetical protein
MTAPVESRGDWQDHAICASGRHSPELWDPELTPRHIWPYVKAMCAACPSQAPCLEDAMRGEGGVEASGRFGIVAGLSPGDRWRLYRERQEVAAGGAA